MKDNVKEYKALKSSNLDSSDLILASYKILRDQLGEKLKPELKSVEANNLKGNYKEGFSIIKRAADELPDDRLATILETRVEIASRNDAPEKDTTKRYFETKFSINLWNSQDVGDYRSLEKPASVMRDNASYDNSVKRDLDRITSVGSKEESASVIVCIREFGDLPFIVPVIDSLRTNSDSLSKRKDRGSKKTGEARLSQNPGIMKANNSMPMDELLYKPEQVRIVDGLNIDRAKVGSFSASNPSMSFVNSVSGTAYATVATLSLYMEKYKDDHNLNRDVNNIVQNFCAFTCKHGYHSMFEMLEVFHSREVKALFDKYNVTIGPMPSNKKGIKKEIDKAVLNLGSALEKAKGFKPIIRVNKNVSRTEQRA